MLQASVPSSAPYLAKEILDFSAISVNCDGHGVDDGGLQVIGYGGGVTADRSYTTLDLVSIQPVIQHLDTLDEVALEQVILNLNPASVPAIPKGLSPINTGGPDALGRR